MEKLLARLARQLEGIDEASLMALWSKYATTTSRFEPTKRWEEAALIFSLIQAKRWKNQLFNYYWSRQANPGEMPHEPLSNPMPEFSLDAPELDTPEDELPGSRCHVLQFRPGMDSEVNSEKDPNQN